MLTFTARKSRVRFGPRQIREELEGGQTGRNRGDLHVHPLCSQTQCPDLAVCGSIRTAPAADCMHTISEHHADIDHTRTDALISPSAAAVHLTGAVWSRASLVESGIVCPEWIVALVEGFGPNRCVLCRCFVTTHSPCAAALPGAVASPSGSPSLSFRVAATVQRVREPECWAVRDFLWRAPLPQNLICQGLGPACPSSRCSSVGGCHRWPASLGDPVGIRHNSCVPGACRWGTPRSGRAGRDWSYWQLMSAADGRRRLGLS